MFWFDHLIALPILLPLLTGVLLIFVDERRHELKLWLNAAGILATLLVTIGFIRLIGNGHFSGDTGVYLAANWIAPFGITLVIDRFAVMMLLLINLVAGASLSFAYTRWSRLEVHFHSLFQFLLMGINGALITGDLFNLFVFFEVMLAASYGLLLHGKNKARVSASMQYIVLNLVASFFFLIGIALIYAATGTLNLADLARIISDLQPTQRTMFETGAALLAIVFLTKSAIWPLGFWLPVTYGAAAPPITAMLVLVTKVGVYVLYRLWMLVFASDASSSTGFGSQLLFWGGMITVGYGSLGLLASQDVRRLASYSAVLSSGIMLTLLGLNQAELTGAAMFYLFSSTLAVTAFVMLIELMERVYSPAAQMLAITMEAFASDIGAKGNTGVIIPGAMVFLGLSFAFCAVVMSGMPPLSGFIAKFGIVATVLMLSGDIGPSLNDWLFIAALFTSGLFAIIALMRLGVRIFWATGHGATLKLHLTEALAIFSLLLLCVMMTIAAGPVRSYMDRIGDDLSSGDNYIEQVLNRGAVASPSSSGGK